MRKSKLTKLACRSNKRPIYLENRFWSVELSFIWIQFRIQGWAGLLLGLSAKSTMTFSELCPIVFLRIRIFISTAFYSLIRIRLQDYKETNLHHSVPGLRIRILRIFLFWESNPNPFIDGRIKNRIRVNSSLIHNLALIDSDNISIISTYISKEKDKEWNLHDRNEVGSGPGFCRVGSGSGPTLTGSASLLCTMKFFELCPVSLLSIVVAKGFKKTLSARY